MISAEKGWGVELLQTAILERLHEITGSETTSEQGVHFVG
jgi:hypothetical protein